MHWLLYAIGVIGVNIANQAMEMPVAIYMFFMLGLVGATLVAHIMHTDKVAREKETNGRIAAGNELLREIRNNTNQLYSIREHTAPKKSKLSEAEVSKLIEDLNPDDEPYELVDSEA